MSLPHHDPKKAAKVDDLEDPTADASINSDAAVNSTIPKPPPPQRRSVSRTWSYGSTNSKAAAAALAADDDDEDIEALLPKSSSNNKLKAHAGLPHVPRRGRLQVRRTLTGGSGDERVSKSPLRRHTERLWSSRMDGSNNSAGNQQNEVDVDNHDDDDEVDADMQNSISSDAAVKQRVKRRSSNSKAAAAVLAAMGSSVGDLEAESDVGDVEEARALLPDYQRTKVRRTATGPSSSSPKAPRAVRRTVSSHSSRGSNDGSDASATSGDVLLPKNKAKKERGQKSTSTTNNMSPEEYALVEKLKKQANAKFNKGDFEAARSIYTDALDVVMGIENLGQEHAELFASLYSNRAMAFYRKKEFQKSIDDCDKAIEYDPNFEKSHTRKWRALVALGDSEAACECLEQAHKAIPSSQKIKEELKKARSQIPLNKKRSWDSRSRHTSRTSSVKSMTSEYQDITENEDCDGRDLMMDISRKSIASTRSHRTLQSIRDEKKTPEELELEQKQARKILCFGLTRCAWTFIVVAALMGFGVGVAVPFILNAKQDNTELIEMSKPPLPAPIDPSVSESTGGTVVYDDNGEPTYIPDIPVDSNVDDTFAPSENNDDTANPAAEVVEEPVVVEIPTIDVWKLFGNETLVLPSVGTAEQLDSMAFDEGHLVRAAQLFVEGMVHKNIRKPALRMIQRSSTPNGTKEEYVIPFMDTPLIAYDGEMPYPTEPRSSSKSGDKYPKGDVGRWEERLKHLGIHESDDTVQLDATNGVLYVARDNRVDVIDTQSGTIRATIALPQPSPQDDAQELLLRDSWLLPMESDESPDWKPAPPMPFIEQLLVTSTLDHLVVVVSNYTSIHQARVKPLLKDSFVTYLFTYHLTHKNNVTEWELVDEEPHAVHGRVLYAAQASSNQHIHIVTSSAIDTARLLEEPLERMYYPEFNDNFYVDEVLFTADAKYIPLYVQRFLDEFQAMEEGAHHMTMMPLTKWISGTAASGNELQLEHTVMAQNHLQELIVVTSLSIVETNSAAATMRQAGTHLSTSTAVVQTAFLGPSGVGVIGSTDVHLTLTVPGYQWTDDRVLQEATHILQWEFGVISQAGTTNLAATRFQGLGTVPGRLIQSSRQSAEKRGRDLRLATALRTQWHMGITDEEEPVIQETSVQKSYIHVLDAETLAPRVGSPLELFEEQPKLLSSVSFLQDIAYAFPLEPVSSSSSVRANKTSIQVVEFEHAADEQTESAALRIAASIASNPVGFSPHIHELSGVGSKQRLLVSIGENKAASGLSMGWMVSIWDASDVSMIVPLVHHPLEPPNTITDWVPQTFRVNPNGQLILPMTIENVGAAKSQTASNPRDISGFVVLDLSPSEINEQTVHVANKATTDPSGCARGDAGCPLEAKSFWLGPGLLTVAGRSVQLSAINMTNSEQPDVVEWALSLSNNGE